MIPYGALDEALAAVERDRVVALPPVACAERSWSYAATGEPFVCITSRGLKKEGRSPSNPPHDTAEEAIAAWLKLVMSYARRRPGVLYWRIKPELECSLAASDPVTLRKYETVPRYTVYSRLLISDKPVIGAKEAA